MSEYELALADLLAAGDSVVSELACVVPYLDDPYARNLRRAKIRLTEALANLRKAAPEAPVTVDRG